jgi:hypothetical protein
MPMGLVRSAAIHRRVARRRPARVPRRSEVPHRLRNDAAPPRPPWSHMMAGRVHRVSRSTPLAFVAWDTAGLRSRTTAWPHDRSFQAAVETCYGRSAPGGPRRRLVLLTPSRRRRTSARNLGPRRSVKPRGPHFSAACSQPLIVSSFLVQGLGLLTSLAVYV